VSTSTQPSVHDQLFDLGVTPWDDAHVRLHKHDMQRRANAGLAGLLVFFTGLFLVGIYLVFTKDSWVYQVGGVIAFIVGFLMTAVMCYGFSQRLNRLQWETDPVWNFHGDMPAEMRELADKLTDAFGPDNVLVEHTRDDPLLRVKTGSLSICVGCWDGNRIIYNGAA
jgi:hypothetical protein